MDKKKGFAVTKLHERYRVSNRIDYDRGGFDANDSFLLQKASAAGCLRILKHPNINRTSFNLKTFCIFTFFMICKDLLIKVSFK